MREVMHSNGEYKYVTKNNFTKFRKVFFFIKYQIQKVLLWKNIIVCLGFLGEFITVLSINGQPGVFYHATVDVYRCTEGFPQAADQSYIEYMLRLIKLQKGFYAVITRVYICFILEGYFPPGLYI